MWLKIYGKIFLFTLMLSTVIFIMSSLKMPNYNWSRSVRKDNSKLEVRHVGFLKVHKAGSTTIQNIITRYSLSKGLTVMLPNERNHLSLNLANPQKWKLQQLPKSHSYDVLIHHTVFSAIGYRTYLPTDTVYITCIREPFSQFISAFYYFRDVYPEARLKNIKGSNPHQIYLREPALYEKKLSSTTHNSMATDFGFPPVFSDNLYLFTKYLTRVDKFFHLVIVLEKFDESMMLLKRLLKWPLKWFLYLPANSHTRAPNITIGVKDKHYYQQWSKLDYILYEFFLEKLEEKLAVQPTEFWQEVTYYKGVIANVTSFCDSYHYNMATVFPESEFSDEFKVTSNECDMMKMKELHLFKIMTDGRKEKLLKYGAQSDYFQNKQKSMNWTALLQLEV